MNVFFKDFALAAPLQQALADLGFESPTEIQRKTLPLLLEQARVDFHGQAQTGTGKTLAFGLPLLHKIDPSIHQPQALIVAPTRELVVQICQSIKTLAKHMPISIAAIYGGASMHEQLRALKQGAHIVVGTPGRLNDHMRRKSLSLQHLSILVFDEADIMLDMGFKDEVDEILNFAPKDRQIWLFSATVKPGIDQIKRSYMKNPLSISVSNQQVGAHNTKQYACLVPMRQRTQALARFIDSVQEFYGFVFCQTKMLATEVMEHLTRLGYKVGTLHGDMSQVQRNRTIKQFKSKEFGILVATDIAARGIDINDITHVVNYSLPNDQESYIHRIGRTGRAGKQGIAITFINKTEQFKISSLQKRFKVAISLLEVPSYEQLAGVQLKRVEDFLQTCNTPVKDAESIVTLLNTYSEQQTKEVLANILADKFFKQLHNETNFSTHNAAFVDEDYKDSSSGRSSRPSNRSSRNNELDSTLQELCINIGAQDGLTKDHVMDYVRKQSTLDRRIISKIRVIRHKTFLVVQADSASKLKGDLDGHMLVGRTVRVQLA